MSGMELFSTVGLQVTNRFYFQHSLKRKHNVYFYAGFIAYILGLIVTIGVMTYFKHAQPALLYLVPACIGLPLFVALIRGDITALFK